MLDIYGRDSPAPHAPIVRNAEFFRIELAPIIDGTIVVSFIATIVDEEEPQLLDQEIAREQIATIDELAALIKAHVRIVPALSPALEHDPEKACPRT